jgi:hypothetical protein
VQKPLVSKLRAGFGSRPAHRDGRERVPAASKPNLKHLKRRIEMKFRKMLTVPLFLIALTTAVFADNVKIDYDHAANFNQVRRTPGQRLRRRTPFGTIG